jgi:hypothetical protein
MQSKQSKAKQSKASNAKQSKSSRVSVSGLKKKVAGSS